jgi:hypothetical protein
VAARVIMLSNWVQSLRFRGNWAEKAMGVEGETENPAYNYWPHEVGVQTLRAAEREIAATRGWRLLDVGTRWHSSCTNTQDGRHYTWLMPHFWRRLAAIVRLARFQRSGVNGMTPQAFGPGFPEVLPKPYYPRKLDL